MCKSKERTLKKERKELEEGAQKEVERLREIVRRLEGAGNTIGTISSGTGQEGGEHGGNMDVSSMTGGDGSLGPIVATEGQGDTTSSTLLSVSISSAQPSSSAISTTHTYSNKTPGAFQSVFRAAPTPGAPVPTFSSTSATSDSTILFAKSTTPLTFREYKPKTATTAMGRLLAENSELSLRVFKDLLLPQSSKVCSLSFPPRV